MSRNWLFCTKFEIKLLHLSHIHGNFIMYSILCNFIIVKSRKNFENIDSTSRNIYEQYYYILIIILILCIFLYLEMSENIRSGREFISESTWVQTIIRDSRNWCCQRMLKYCLFYRIFWKFEIKYYIHYTLIQFYPYNLYHIFYSL